MPAPKPPLDATTAGRIEQAVSPERLASYQARSGGDLVTAVELYRWNGELSGAIWETLGHVEVLLRNALAGRMATRQHRVGRSMSWLDDPAVGLTGADGTTSPRRSGGSGPSASRRATAR